MKRKKIKICLENYQMFLSIRKGKFGAYGFYKTDEMKKPQFLNIKKFKGSILTCEKEVIIKWLEDNYPILNS